MRVHLVGFRAYTNPNRRIIYLSIIACMMRQTSWEEVASCIPSKCPVRLQRKIDNLKNRLSFWISKIRFLNRIEWFLGLRLMSNRLIAANRDILYLISFWRTSTLWSSSILNIYNFKPFIRTQCWRFIIRKVRQTFKLYSDNSLMSYITQLEDSKTS